MRIALPALPWIRFDGTTIREGNRVISVQASQPNTEEVRSEMISFEEHLELCRYLWSQAARLQGSTNTPNQKV